MKNIAVIDIQGFKTLSKKFIIKELAISYNEREFQHFLIKPPYEFSSLTVKEQKQINWLTRNYHGLIWDEGSISFRSLIKFLLKNLDDTIVYVKGEEKRLFMSKTFKKKIIVYDLDELGCPNLHTLRQNHPNILRCISHDGCCALQNIFVLRHYVDADLNETV